MFLVGVWIDASTLALCESIALAVHFEDVDVVGEAIQQRAGEPLGTEHAGPFVERWSRSCPEIP